MTFSKLFYLMAAMGLCMAAAVESSEPKPNFLVILADDMGYSDAGCFGGEIDTPNLDRLAENGLRFSQCYSSARCWSSRQSLLSGFYYHSIKNQGADTWVRTIPDYLKPLGYRSYHSGKWHLEVGKLKPWPVGDGHFDRSYWVKDDNRTFNPNERYLDDERMPPVTDPGFYRPASIADYTIEQLREHREKYPDQPFFSYVAFLNPHFPLHAPQERIAKYKERYLAGWDVMRQQRWERIKNLGLISGELSDPDRDIRFKYGHDPEGLKKALGPGQNGYATPWDEQSDAQKEFMATKMAIHAAMVDAMDEEIGRIIDELKATGEFDNTFIIFMSDNGASAEEMIRGDGHNPSAPLGSKESFLCLGQGWSHHCNTPLRFHKSWVHEGGISSPCIISYPAGISATENGGLRHCPIHFIDLVPTLVELADGTVSPEWNGFQAPPLRGKSFAGVLEEDQDSIHEAIFFRHIGNLGIRMGDWKLTRRIGYDPVDAQRPEWELYNMADDRCETENLASAYPERVQRMKTRWEEEQKECDLRLKYTHPRLIPDGLFEGKTESTGNELAQRGDPVQAGMKLISSGKSYELSTRLDAAAITDNGMFLNPSDTAPYSFHTQNENTPSVTIDLEHVFPVSGMTIQNRQDHRREIITRAVPLLVEMSEDGSVWNEVWATTEAQAEWSFTLKKPVSTRYVRIEKASKGFLHLRRALIYSAP